MNELNEFDFSIYEISCLENFKQLFIQEFKKSNNLNFDELANFCLKDMGLPAFCPLLKSLKKWYDKIYHLSFLNDSLTKSDLTELILHSNRNFQIQTSQRQNVQIIDLSENDFQLALEVLASKHCQEWNNSKPFASFQARIDNCIFRISMAHFSTSANNQSKVFFRKLGNEHFNLNSYSQSLELDIFLKSIISSHANIAVCGATGSGKTSLLRSLIAEISDKEHIITIEDTHELMLNKEGHTSFIAKSEVQNSMKSYCKYSLRMKPDRILIGEIRGEEVVPFLLSANSGHKGMMTSLHANSAQDCLSRLALLFQIYADQKGLSYEHVLKLICQGLDYIIYMENHQVAEIIKVLGSEGITPYYEKIIDTMR